MLAYDPVSNEAEWIPVWATVSDLSQVKEASARELSNMVPHNSDEGARRLNWFGKQRSKSGVEESGAEDNVDDNDGDEEGLKETPHKEETRGEPMDQGYEEDSDRNKESGSTDTSDSSHSPASSQDRMSSLHCYFSECHASGGSWADQCLSKDGGDLASADEESASHGTIEENDGEREKPLTSPASREASRSLWKSHGRGWRSRKTPMWLSLLWASSCLQTAKIMLYSM